MSYVDKVRNYLDLKKAIGDVFALVINSSIDELVDIFLKDPGKVDYFREMLYKYKEKILTADVSKRHREKLKAQLDEVEYKINRAYRMVTAKPEIEVSYSYREVQVYPGEEVNLTLYLKNKYRNPAQVALTIEAGSGVEFESGKVYKERLKLLPEEEREIRLRVKGLSPGETGFKKTRVEAFFENGEKFSKTFQGIQIIVKKFPEIEVERKVSRVLLKEVEAYKVTVKVKNKDSETIKLTIRERPPSDLFLGVESSGGSAPDNMSTAEWSVELSKGEVAEFTYFLRIPDQEVELPPTEVEMLLGNYVKKLVFKSTSTRLKPAKKQKHLERTKTEADKEKAEKPASSERSVTSFSVDNLLADIAKTGISAFLGYMVGSKLVPETKKMPKPVYIQDDLRWTTKIVENEEITIIFENPESIVVEDRGDYIQIRRATVPEIVATTTPRLAWILEREFINWIKGASKHLYELGSVKVSEPKPLVDFVEIVEKESKKSGVSTDKEKLKTIPSNLYTIITIGGGLLKKPRVKIYVFVLSRLDRLYRSGVDHQPLSLSEAMEMSREAKINYGEDTVFVFASPSGWDPQSISEAKRDPDPHRHIVLVDLKTGEVFYNDSKSFLRKIVDRMFYGYSPALIPVDSDEVDKYASLLLDGIIDEKMFLESLSNITRHKMKVEKQTVGVHEESS